MHLIITQQFAKIGLNIKKPFLSLKTTKPQIELNIQKPEIQIESPKPKIYIDQRQCFSDFNKRSLYEFSHYYAQLAHSDVIEGIGRISAEGDMLAEIKGVSIPDLSQAALDTQADFNVTAIPKQRPIIEFETHPVKIELKKGTVDLKLHRGTIENNFDWGKVQPYILQKNFIKIDWIENKKDILV